MIVLAVVLLLIGCGAAGAGMWLGYEVGRGDAVATTEYVATVTRDAYQQGVVEGMTMWMTPAPPERPYDIEADR